jgi:hypothetical protein
VAKTEVLHPQTYPFKSKTAFLAVFLSFHFPGGLPMKTNSSSPLLTDLWGMVRSNNLNVDQLAGSHLRTKGPIVAPGRFGKQTLKIAQHQSTRHHHYQYPPKDVSKSAKESVELNRSTQDIRTEMAEEIRLRWSEIVEGLIQAAKRGDVRAFVVLREEAWGVPVSSAKQK